MSTEPVNNKKRAASDPIPVPDGDHRKRRRNRTTQSCLNCHTSKRMCDRKRPACARCTQLGLTGLCVYEVDDPSQRTDTQDESSRLLKRVAELEGVIRELKNKPHPRWVQSSNSVEEFEKWHSRPGGIHESSSNAPSPPALSSSDSVDTGNSNGRNSVTPPSIRLQTAVDSRRMRSPYSPGSPMSGSSPGLATPTDDYPYSPVGIAGQCPIQDYDLTSMFLNYPGMMSGDGGFPTLSDNKFSKQTDSHCGCVMDQNSYNTMLELSLRLRKASDVLSRAPSHQLGGFCQLHQRVTELDTFATNALSDGCSSPFSDRLHPSVQGSFNNLQLYPQRPSPPSRGSNSNGPWNILSPACGSPLDDSFMTWEPPRRT